MSIKAIFNLVYFDVINGSVRFIGLRQNLDHVKGRISLIYHLFWKIIYWVSSNKFIVTYCLFLKFLLLIIWIFFLWLPHVLSFVQRTSTAWKAHRFLITLTKHEPSIILCHNLMIFLSQFFYKPIPNWRYGTHEYFWTI